MKRYLYCKTKFGRGTGLGNRLFVWARCRLFAHIHEKPMISPIWTRLAIGQLLRGGIDYKSYMRQLILLKLFKKRSGNIGIFKGSLLSLLAKEVDEPNDLSDKNYGELDNKYSVKVVFKGWKKFFEPLNEWDNFLYQELRMITQRKYLDFVDSIKDVPIAICVRCGNDFKEPGNYNYAPIGPIDKTPMRWFIESLSLIRKAAGYPAMAYVVSDGTTQQLRELLKMENVKFVRPGSAISDLLILAKAKVLLASGASSFAAWGCFFGQMPSISHPGQPLASIWGIKNKNNQFIGEFNPLNPSYEFLRQVFQPLQEDNW